MLNWKGSDVILSSPPETSKVWFISHYEPFVVNNDADLLWWVKDD